MTEGQSLEGRIERVEGKLDTFMTSVGEGFAEQRAYTEFAFQRLRTEMIGRFDKVDERFDKMDARFDRMDARFGNMDARFNRLERKLDQFIDRQTRANELTERRLQLLERPKTPE